MKTLFLAAAVLLLPTVSNAADLPVKAAPIPVSTYNWTGFYAGIIGGYGWSDPSYTLTGENAAGADWIRQITRAGSGSTTFQNGFSASGGTVGVVAGYDFQFARSLVAGIVADLNYSGIKGSSFWQPPVAGAPDSITADSRLNWFGTVRGRLGWSINEKLLVYGTGGVAFGEVKNSAAYAGNFGGIISRGFFPADNSAVICPAFGNCIAGDASHTSIGWAAGAGGEARLTPNVSLTAEYLHVNLDSPTVHMVNLAPPGFLGNINPGRIASSYGSANYDIIRGAITYRFH